MRKKNTLIQTRVWNEIFNGYSSLIISHYLLSKRNNDQSAEYNEVENVLNNLNRIYSKQFSYNELEKANQIILSYVLFSVSCSQAK